MLTQAPRGTKDFYGDEIYLWRKLEDIIRQICIDFNVSEIRTPTFEHTELFQRGVGETTDVVQKEMYTFMDKGNRSITLKPEGTAGVVRCFIQNKMYADLLPIKMYYVTPLYRYEKPQAGRCRQFHSFGVEMFGSSSPAADVEIMSIGHELLKRVGIQNTTLHINSIGGTDCHNKYNELLKNYIGSHLDVLCDTCKERYEKNPLRVLDCKNDACKTVMAQAPSIIENLGPECKAHFEEVQRLLTEMGIDYVVDEKIVRGLDYYTKTVFEFICPDVGAQSTVCGGGRYDNLVETCGGPKTSAVGFGMGLERIVIALEKQNMLNELKPKIKAFVGSIGEAGYLKAQALVFELRKNGISAEGDTMKRSVKAQLKYADKLNVKYAIVLGDDEISQNCVTIKNMETGEQQKCDLNELVAFFAKDSE